MKTLLELITIEVEKAFKNAGYEEAFGKVTLSNRPDLCEYQCNGAMAAAKTYKKAPAVIAGEVAEQLKGCNCFSMAEAVNPGFINLKARESFLAQYLCDMALDSMMGVEREENPRTVIVDYGGPNVAKPLHVGHLRSAIIGESVKRIARFKGNHVIGDIHLGDWGYQMGLIITELKSRQPGLPYFDASFEGEYPKEAPFTIGELEEIYPAASARAKEDEKYREEALKATFELQNGRPGYRAVWKHIMGISVEDLKKNYQKLKVEFDLWKGEADVQEYIPGMVDMLKKEGYAYYDDGALVVDVRQEGDKKEVPPCMILKSDGAALYDTTDLATLVEREKLYSPDEIIYLADKRQELHFVQVFRCARKTGIVRPEVELKFLGFGTMNGKDGKPFKTRDGGVMRLEKLISEINGEMYKKITENRTVSQEEAEDTSQIVGLAAIKYGDLSNQASKDYIFDVDRFTSFEGNTGPYILYTMVRIKSILNKYQENGGEFEGVAVQPPCSEYEKTVMLETAKFNDVINTAYMETAPHKICAYLFDLSNAFNRFYHETKILAEEDKTRREGYIALLKMILRILEICIGLLGFDAPERM